MPTERGPWKLKMVYKKKKKGLVNAVPNSRTMKRLEQLINKLRGASDAR